jgi:hypothetical protein
LRQLRINFSAYRFVCGDPILAGLASPGGTRRGLASGWCGPDNLKAKKGRVLRPAGRSGLARWVRQEAVSSSRQNAYGGAAFVTGKVILYKNVKGLTGYRAVGG